MKRVTRASADGFDGVPQRLLRYRYDIEAARAAGETRYVHFVILERWPGALGFETHPDHWHFLAPKIEELPSWVTLDEAQPPSD